MFSVFVKALSNITFGIDAKNKGYKLMSFLSKVPSNCGSLD